MIKKNKKWESLIGIVIAVALLWFVILWIANLIIYSNTVNENYEVTTNIELLKDNTLNSIQKTNIANIIEWENFYLYKDNWSKNFIIYTWASNIQYKFVDKFWDKVIPASLTWVYYYERSITLQKKDLINWNNVFIINVNKKRN